MGRERASDFRGQCPVAMVGWWEAAWVQGALPAARGRAAGGRALGRRCQGHGRRPGRLGVGGEPRRPRSGRGGVGGAEKAGRAEEHPSPSAVGAGRAVRRERAARQHSPQVAQRGGDAGIARISLHGDPRPGALGRFFFLHSSPRRERRPSRVRHVRGRVAAPPAGPPTRLPSHPPAGRPAGGSRGAGR